MAKPNRSVKRKSLQRGIDARIYVIARSQREHEVVVRSRVKDVAVNQRFLIVIFR